MGNRITPGTLANGTVLGVDPSAVDPAHLDEVQVLGTGYEAQWFPTDD
ncbi:MAG: hypothetical protein ABW137_23065 [Mycobacterium sp.]